MIEMHHKDESWQLHYGSPGRGQQYRCIICGIGGASGSGSPPPLTYNCHNKTCNGQNTMWPTPQYSLYRLQVLALEEARKNQMPMEFAGWFTYCHDKEKWLQGNPKGPEFHGLFTQLFKRVEP